MLLTGDHPAASHFKLYAQDEMEVANVISYDTQTRVCIVFEKFDEPKLVGAEKSFGVFKQVQLGEGSYLAFVSNGQVLEKVYDVLSEDKIYSLVEQHLQLEKVKSA
jgi:hypothetical protein